jgi:hypothetical protein
MKGSILAVDNKNDCIVQEDFTALRCDKESFLLSTAKIEPFIFWNHSGQS